MAFTSIPITAIFEYVQFYPFTEAEAHLFVDIIRRIDARHVRLINDKHSATTDK